MLHKLHNTHSLLENVCVDEFCKLRDLMEVFAMLFLENEMRCIN